MEACSIAVICPFSCASSAAVGPSPPIATYRRPPTIAFLTVSIGPSAVAILIYLGYKAGLLQLGPSGYHFSSFIFQLPLEFALMNWGFVALYVICRLSPNSASARPAMWLSATAMSFFNLPLFLLPPEMVSNVRDAGQGIGIIQAVLSMPLWFGPYPDFLQHESVIGLLVLAPLTPIPFSGLVGWLVGRFTGTTANSPKAKTGAVVVHRRYLSPPAWFLRMHGGARASRGIAETAAPAAYPTAVASDTRQPPGRE